MTEKIKIHSRNLVQETITCIRKLFPNCVTEAQDGDGRVRFAVDFDQLRQELSEVIVEGREERYQISWPGKQAATIVANAPITKTLRPCYEESVDFDTTKNLFIEGDNLDTLKLLQETYLGKVKMIYIDPPYNTGDNFIYKDDFTESAEGFLKRSKQKDQEGNPLVANLESNGRFHSDWLSMIYPRLKLGKVLLSEDGVIFISIDDYEVHNMRKICDELFGANNFIACLPTIMNLKGNNDEFGFAGTHEYTLVFAKNRQELSLNEFPVDSDELEQWEEDDIGLYKRGANLKATGRNAFRKRRPNLWFPLFVTSNDRVLVKKPKEPHDKLFPITKGQQMSWRWSKDKFRKDSKDLIVVRNSENISIYKKQRPKLGELPTKKPKSTFYKPEYSSGNGTSALKNLFGAKLFDVPPKPPILLKDLIQIGSDKEAIIMDFFAGSATTAYAVMLQNAQDGGNRKFIMVQLPESCEEESEAFRKGFVNIAEIAKERIRLVGKEILRGECHKDWNKDIGFRVLKVDSSNMVDVYYNPSLIAQEQLETLTDNIKSDREPEDLLFQVLLDWGIDLSLSIRKQVIQDNLVFFVNGNALVACFDSGVTESLVEELSRLEPQRVVFRDDGFASDSIKINVRQIFKQMSPSTEVKSI